MPVTQDEKDIRFLYLAGATVSELATEFALTEPQIRRRLRKQHIPLRGVGTKLSMKEVAKILTEYQYKCMSLKQAARVCHREPASVAAVLRAKGVTIRELVVSSEVFEEKANRLLDSLCAA